MTKKTFILIAIASCAWIAACFGATIPAGTTLVVQTIDAISSRAVVGRTFTARLDQDVAVNGKVVLRAGTKVLGKIEASRANPRNSKPLTVNLTWTFD
jgi:serine acetyltransferase